MSDSYIPKYITSKPWYHTSGPDDALSHQRKDPNTIVDYNEAVSGQGIRDEFVNGARKDNDEFETKRDRWYGYDGNDWEAILQDWDRIRRSKRQNSVEEKDDSDDTDYELELLELGLDRDSLKRNVRESTLEKNIRDRQDIPAYLRNITAHGTNGRFVYDPKSRVAKDTHFLNNDDTFVRSDAKDLKDLQKFAWEMNREKGEECDLDLSVEASPTLVQLKKKQSKDTPLKRALMERYGKKEVELASSRYPEDVYPGNHTSVWGSVFENGMWGYSCCGSYVQESTCRNRG